MNECISAQLSENERREVAAVARRAASDGAAVPSIEQMALALLRSHLVLMRDCASILPAGVKPEQAVRDAGSVYIGKHGVSLRDGMNAGALPCFCRMDRHGPPRLAPRVVSQPVPRCRKPCAPPHSAQITCGCAPKSNKVRKRD